jgi:rod shape-determining protein MreD
MTWLKWAAFFVVCFLLQSTVVPSIAILGVKPDFVILVLFIFAVKTNELPATWAGFILGLAQDIYAPGALGLNALAKTVAGFFAGLFNEKTVRIDPIYQGVALLLMFVLNDSIYMTVQAVQTHGSFGKILLELFTGTLPRALYTLVFAALPFIWENLKPVSRK